MASIYIHVPYCRQACLYCDFHFSTSLKTKDELLKALKLELFQRKDYLAGEKITTVYFGGGTPSLLEKREIERILETIEQNYDLERDSLEITLEANPDDLTAEKIEGLYQSGINRLSIGVQSFHDTDLVMLNRVHNAAQSKRCIEDARKQGFENISIDLIYGIQGQDDKSWMKNLEQLALYNLPHFSAYSLTVEPKTALAKMIKLGKMANTDEEQTARQFLTLQHWAEENGYIAYEISNYCRPGQFSKHNTGYWNGEKYLGVGPSAHSFNAASRQWNIANNIKYLQNIIKGLPYFETEELTEANKFNEYVMTSLRTVWGCDINIIKERFGLPFAKAITESSKHYVSDKLLFTKGNALVLTMAGKLIADTIISGLFVIDDDDVHLTP